MFFQDDVGGVGGGIPFVVVFVDLICFGTELKVRFVLVYSIEPSLIWVNFGIISA